MNAGSITLNVLVVALLGGCAAAPVQEEEQESLGLRIFMGVTEFLVTAAFDAAFSTEKPEKQHQRERHHERKTSYAPSTAQTTRKPTPVSLVKKKELQQ